MNHYGYTLELAALVLELGVAVSFLNQPHQLHGTILFAKLARVAPAFPFTNSIAAASILRYQRGATGYLVLPSTVTPRKMYGL